MKKNAKIQNDWPVAFFFRIILLSGFHVWVRNKLGYYEPSSAKICTPNHYFWHH